MCETYVIKGFTEYEIVDKVLYRKEYRTESVSCKFQYRAKRKIGKTLNNKIEGYILVKNKKRKWYSLNRLRKLLVKI